MKKRSVRQCGKTQYVPGPANIRREHFFVLLWGKTGARRAMYDPVQGPPHTGYLAGRKTQIFLCGVARHNLDITFSAMDARQSQHRFQTRPRIGD